LLAGASVPGPYVLVGASHGGYMTMSYALYYPSETAGLVFVGSVGHCTCVVSEVEPGQFELASVSFGARPVVVLRASLTDGRDLASRATNSILVNANSTHFVAQERPSLWSRRRASSPPPSVAERRCRHARRLRATDDPATGALAEELNAAVDSERQEERKADRHREAAR